MADAPSNAVSGRVAGGNPGVTKNFLLAIEEIKRAGHITEVKLKCIKKVRLIMVIELSGVQFGLKSYA